jgi:hypothetical protein
MISCLVDIDSNQGLHVEPLEKMGSVWLGNKSFLLQVQAVHIQTWRPVISIGYQNLSGATSHNLLAHTFTTDIELAPRSGNRVRWLIRTLK